MATIKQVKMMVARSAAVGMDYDWEALKALDNGQVDEKLQEIEAHSSKKQVVTDIRTITIKPNFNVVRFGMCCKLVAGDKPIRNWLADCVEYRKEVEELYVLLTELEEKLIASSSQV